MIRTNRLDKLANESIRNRKRLFTVDKITKELSYCNIISNKILSLDFFNIDPKTVNELHTPCNTNNEFNIKIGALSIIFEVDVKKLRKKVKKTLTEWKSVRLIEEWVK